MEGSPPMDFRILGPVEAHDRGRPLPLGGVKQRALLSILLLHAGEAVTTDQLIDELWGEEPPQTARKALQVAVSRLRKVLDSDGASGTTLVTKPSGYAIELADEELDLWRFQARREEARAAMARGDPALAASLLRDALALWRGPPLADVAFERFAQNELRRLQELRLAALEERIEADLAVGRDADLVPEIEALVRQEPLRERLRCLLMLALYRVGRQADALAAFHSARETLVEQLGIEPGRSLQELHEAILRQDPSLELRRPAPPGPTGTVTLLFTDLVQSTALFAALAPERAEELRRAYFSLLRDAVAATGGTEVKSLGDGLMVVFPGVGPALDCAVAMQQQVERHAQRVGAPLRMRVGISHGDVSDEEGDYFGRPVIEAARLCAAAEGAQILVAESVRRLAEDRRWKPAGEMPLKGLPDPVRAFEVPWEPLAPPRSRIPLPDRLAAAADAPFLGRSAESRALHDALARASEGRRQVVLISGEPGIGKTRLAAALAAEAHAAGAVVLYGRSDEDTGPSYQPFVEAIGHYVKHAGEELSARHPAARSPQLSRLAPELGGGPAGASQTDDPEGERYLLFSDVASLLASASREHGLVLVLDDLHWAAKPTVQMLGALVRAPQPMSLLVVVTYRSTELAPDTPLAALLASLAGEPDVVRLALEGLRGEDVAALMAAASDDEPAAGELVEAVHRETGGNPLFVGEVIRHIKESGASAADVAEIGLPSSLRDVIGRRVARLGPVAERVLSVAAVIGSDLDVELLGRVAGLPEGEVSDAIDAAVKASLLQERPGPPPRLAFAHALTEHTLYEGLGPAQRGRIHRAVAEALEAATDHEATTVAYHWLRALPADVRKGVEHARRAGDAALAGLAPGDAAHWYSHALALLERAPAEPELRCELLIGLGEAQRQGGDPAFRGTLLEAARVARELGDADRLVRAVLANSRGFVSASGEVDHDRVAALEAALEAIPERGDRRRALLLATLAAELSFARDFRRRRHLSDGALELARDSGDPAALSRVLTLRFVTIWTPETLDERLSNTAENVVLADRLGDPVAQFGAVHWRAAACIEAGEMDEAARMVEREARLAERLGQPTARWLAAYDRANIDLLEGRLEDAERSATGALRIGLESSQPDAQPFYASQLASIRFDQGRLAELQPNIAQLVAHVPGIPGFRALLALACCEGELYEEAGAILAREASSDFSELPYDVTWLAVMCIYAEVGARLGDAHAAALLYERLARCRDQFVFTGVTANGSVSRALGLLAATLGRAVEAEERLGRAVALHESMGAPVWLARTRLELARVLLRGGDDPDLQRARALLAEARRVAGQLGCAGIEQRAASLMGYADALGELARSTPEGGGDHA